jgi:hypothetical protein
MGFLRKLFGKKEPASKPAVVNPPASESAASTKADEVVGYKSVTTTHPSEAASALLKEAIKWVPLISDEELQVEFTDMRRAWGSQRLFTGDAKMLENLVKTNLNELSNKSGFEEFQVILITDQKCAQVNTFFANSFMGVRLWRTQDSINVCGNSIFHDISN